MEDNNMKIRITTDSNCDLCPELIARYGIEVLPLPIELEGKSYFDGVDITPDDIITSVNRGADLPKTSAASVGDLQDFFKRVLADCDAIIHFSLGTGFSCGFQNANIAREDLPVYCVDTRNLSTGSSMIIAEAADMLEKGMSPEEIVEAVEAMREKVDCSFVLDRLDYLYKGGRCSMLAMLGANVLHLRPCIEVKDNKMGVGKKYRGTYERCVRQYLNDRLKDTDGIETRRVFLTHTGLSAEVLESIRSTIAEKISFDEVYVVRAGCSITCHCGDNTFGIIIKHK